MSITVVVLFSLTISTLIGYIISMTLVSIVSTVNSSILSTGYTTSTVFFSITYLVVMFPSITLGIVTSMTVVDTALPFTICTSGTTVTCYSTISTTSLTSNDGWTISICLMSVTVDVIFDISIGVTVTLEMVSLMIVIS
jgi:hypothetical protein